MNNFWSPFLASLFSETSKNSSMGLF